MANVQYYDVILNRYYRKEHGRYGEKKYTFLFTQKLTRLRLKKL